MEQLCRCCAVWAVLPWASGQGGPLDKNKSGGIPGRLVGAPVWERRLENSPTCYLALLRCAAASGAVPLTRVPRRESCAPLRVMTALGSPRD